MSTTVLQTEGHEISKCESFLHSNGLSQKISARMVSHSFEPAMIGPYYIIRNLGHGAYATVWLGIHPETGEEVALKCIDKQQLLTSQRSNLPTNPSPETSPSNAFRRIETEVHALTTLDGHPNIMRMIEFLETPCHFVIVAEYVSGGDFYQFLRRACWTGNAGHGLPTYQTFGFFYQLVSAVGFCHSHGIAHRDLKPENILMTKDRKTLKLADFGMAGLVKPDQLMQASCGSPHYIAPEIIRGEKYDGRACDIWSLGVILYVMCCGRLPFVDPSILKVLKMVLRGKYEVPCWFTEDLCDLIQRMLCLDPRQRITIQEFMVHPWWLRHCRELGLNPMGTSEKPPGLPLAQGTSSAPILPPYDVGALGWMIRVQGYHVDTLLEELKADYPNDVKARYVLLRQQTRSPESPCSPPNVVPVESDETRSSSNLPTRKEYLASPLPLHEPRGDPPTHKARWASRKVKSLLLVLREKICGISTRHTLA